MNRRRVLLVCGALLILATHAFAESYEGGGYLNLAKPSGEFGEAVNDVGVGLAVQGGIRPLRMITFGLGVNYMMYGSMTRRYAVPLVEDVNVKTTNNLVGAFVYSQFRPIPGPVQPYAEICAGINYMWTQSQLEDRDWYDDGVVGRKINYADFARFVGYGGGLLMLVNESSPYDVHPHAVFVDLKVMYMRGEKAKYLTQGDVLYVGNTPVFDVSRSPTDMTVFKFGVIVTWD